jgi:hypothetical protein
MFLGSPTTAGRVLRLVLLVLTSFLALTAFARGTGLLADINAPPVDVLQGTSFRNHTILGIALFVIVRGTALAEAYLLLMRHPLAASSALLSGTVIIGV